ncbi:glycosyltransferase [bacterium]|nr:glycosyltransferase [bacterium]MBT4551636.1 glycosyltransferase [bacterium]MBT7088026.1 glycosyltransferase [bacterium]
MSKILLLTANFHIGGAQRVLANLSSLLAEKHEIYIGIFDARNIGYRCKGKIIDLNVPVSSNLIGKTLNFLKRIYKTARFKKKEHIDITISFCEGANIVSLLSGYSKNILTVHSYKSRDNFGFYGFIFKYLMKFFYNRADKIVAVSEGASKDLITNFSVQAQKTISIHNFIDQQKITQLSTEAIEPELKNIFKTPTLITVGRLSEPKGQWHLLRIFKQTKKTIPNLKLLILGDGELREKLIKLSHDLSLKTYSAWDQAKLLDDSYDVYFLGFTDNIFKYMAHSSIFVFTSLWEGFGNVLIEAMACRLPVIATDCKHGPREILGAKYGILVPALSDQWLNTEELTKEEQKFAKTILMLLNDPALSQDYRQKGYFRAQDFDVAQIKDQWFQIIKELG